MKFIDIPAKNNLEVLGVARFNKKENTIILLICKENGLDANTNSQKRICDISIFQRGTRKNNDL